MTLLYAGREGFDAEIIDKIDRPCVFTTMRWDQTLIESMENTAASCKSSSPVYLLEHHWTRLQVAKWGTGWYEEGAPAKLPSPAHLLHLVNTAVRHWQIGRSETEALRLKLRCYVGGKMSVEITTTDHLALRQLFPKSFGEPTGFGVEFAVVVDTQPIETTEVTMYKTSYRECYARARSEAAILSHSDNREVLLYREDGTVFDGSISTPYFFRSGRWITPTSASGGQQGVTRRWALENHLAVEGDITIDQLIDRETVWLSNAVKGYFRGVLLNRTPNKE